jgi:mannose-1-phosphate guanylyltransferase/mannose-6-phosphate isomerase
MNLRAVAGSIKDMYVRLSPGSRKNPAVLFIHWAELATSMVSTRTGCWGSYEGIDSCDRIQVKRVVGRPGAGLSLQMHHHRAEHWVVVKGTALVTNGDNEIILTENQSTYIPLGITHRVKIPGKIPLELIEVQSGAYLGEDDIVRFEDAYGRAEKA